jgi:hypothetical protein
MVNNNNEPSAAINRYSTVAFDDLKSQSLSARDKIQAANTDIKDIVEKQRASVNRLS